MNKRTEIGVVTFLITGTLFFIFYGLVYGKGFLIPVTTAIIFSMIILPIAKKLESWGLGKGLAIFLADLVILVFIAGIIYVVILQGASIGKNWGEFETRMRPKVEQLRNFYDNNFNFSASSQDQQAPQQEQETQTGLNQNDQPPRDELQQNPDSAQQAGQTQQTGQQGEQGGQNPLDSFMGNLVNQLTSIATNTLAILGDMLLILVYIFFFLFYREKFEGAIIMMFPDDQKEKVKEIITESSKEAQNYMLGRFILILVLVVFYMIGFSIAGLQGAIFISVIAAILSLIPYLGNILAVLLIGGVALVTGNEVWQLLVLGITFIVVQFVESYILEPFIVGKTVDLNPVIVIVAVVLGGVVWGIMGMILSIPIVAIMKVVFNNVESLDPLGYALDERDIGSESKIVAKMKGLLGKGKK